MVQLVQFRLCNAPQTLRSETLGEPGNPHRMLLALAGSLLVLLVLLVRLVPP